MNAMREANYFPGCSLKGTAVEYDVSARRVCQCLEIKLTELPDWSCCGASAAHHTRHLLATALSCRNLSLANGKPIVIPCPSCYSQLKSAQLELHSNPQLKEEMQQKLGLNGTGSGEAVSLLEYLSGREILERVRSSVKKDLQNIKVVTYYGCLLVRPPKVSKFDDPEDPVSMDRLLQAAGVGVLPWDYKVQCCGAGLGMMSQLDTLVKLSGEILEMAKQAGADAIAVACPLCHANLDLRQPQISRILGIEYKIPVLYFTQLLGLAFGLSAESLGLDKHIVDAAPLLAELS